jgi:hypothetical protein
MMPQVNTRLPGRRLVIVRAAWLALTGLTIGLYLASFPSFFDFYRSVCAPSPSLICDQQLTDAQVKALAGWGFSIGDYAIYVIALSIVFAMVHLAIALVIFARRSDDWFALFVALMLVTFGLVTFSDPLRWLATSHPAWWLPIQLVKFIGEISFLIFFYTFPSGQFVPRWVRLPAALWVITEMADYFWPDSPFDPDTWPLLLAILVLMTFMGTGLFAQVYRYRHVSNARQRQQTKWVVLGVALALGGFAGVVLLILIMPSLQQNVLGKLALNTSFPLFMLLIPLSIGIAMLRSGLWDIDRLINRTMVYGTLSVALVGVYGGSVALLQQLFRVVTGQTSQLAVVASTLAIAALFNPCGSGSRT